MAKEFETEHDRQMAQLEAEQISRRDEATASILRSKSRQSPTDELKKALEEATNKSLESAKRLSEIIEAGVKPDYAGTKMNVADSKGNVPENVEVSNAGGVGVGASNSAGDTTKPATNAEQAVSGTPTVAPEAAPAGAKPTETAKTETPKK